MTRKGKSKLLRRVNTEKHVAMISTLPESYRRNLLPTKRVLVLGEKIGRAVRTGASEKSCAIRIRLCRDVFARIAAERPHFQVSLGKDDVQNLCSGIICDFLLKEVPDITD